MEVIHNILIEFGVPMKMVRIVKICVNETVDKHLLHKFFIQNDSKQKLKLKAIAVTSRGGP
jgi:hypothetical protein